jgi:polyisoprenoid-binding protein YceI
METGKFSRGRRTNGRVVISHGFLLFLGLALLLAVRPFAIWAQTITAPASAQEIFLTLDPAQTKVHWMVDSTLHTVRGTFALKSGTVHFDPVKGKAGGEIIVLAASGESGNSGRDGRMHREILESAKFPEVTFRPEQIEGKVAMTGASDVRLMGIFSIHGADHELTAQVHAELAGGHSAETWTGTGKFEVPYVSWSMKDPSNFLLKVKPVVSVEVEMTGTIKMGR